jgi:hypothetical protein
VERVGLIAGAGSLPRLIAKDARARGMAVVAVALKGMADAGALHGLADVVREFGVGKLGSVIRFLKEQGAARAVFAGKIEKRVLYSKGFIPDLHGLKTLAKLRDWRDDTIIDTVAAEFLASGIELMDMKEFCAGMLAPTGVLTRRAPTKAERADVEFGFEMAKGVGALDIGQTVVVKDRAVIAVEAIEGTDACILRSGALAAGAVVVKVSRPGQDMRFDVPTVGIETLAAMREARASVLALESGKSIFMDRAEFIRQADDAGIVVLGTTGVSA